MAASPTDNSKETKKADTKANPDVHKPGSDQTAGASHAKTATKLLESNTVADTRATLKADLDRKNAEHSAVGGLHVASANGDTVTLNSKGQVDKVERAGGKASLDIGYQNGKPSTIKDKDGVWQSTDGVNFTLNGHHKTLEVNKSNFNVDFKDATANDNGKARPPEPAAKQADTRAAGQPQPNGKKPPEHSQWLDMGKSIFAGAANELNKIAHKIEGEVEAPKTAAPPEQAVKPGAGRTDNPTRPKPAEQPTPPGSKPSDQPGKPAPEVATPSTPVPPTLDAATLEKTAQDLHDALNKKEWFGLKNAPDKDKINSLLEPLSQTDRAALAQVYHKDFDEKGPPDTLMNALKDKLGGDGSVDFRKAEAVMNRQDGRTNDAGALMVAITDAQQDKEKGNAEIRAVFETLNSKQIGQMSQDFQNKYGKSYQDALKGAQLTDATQAALPILEKGVDLKDANDVKSLANIAVDKQDPHLLAEALRGDSPAATQARKDLQNDQTFKNKLADAFPSDASVNLQENGMDPKSLPFESRTDQVAQDYLNEGNISLATIASQNTGKWIFDNKDNLALAAKNATDKERQDFSLGREIADGTKTNDGTPASKEAVDYYDKIHAAFKAGGNDREVSTWEDSLINGRSTIVTDLANTHSDGWGPLGFGKGEKPQDILSKAENLSQADYNLLKDPTKGPEFRKELQDSLNTYADPGDAKRVMSLIDQKVAAPDYASAEKIHRSLEDTISDNKGHVFLGMGTSYDGNNITKNITTLSPADAQQYKSDPAFRKTVDDFVSKNLSGDDQLLAQRVLANVAQDGKPPTLDQTDTFLQDRTNGADPTKQLQDAEAAMKADPTLQARLSKPDGQLSAADQQLKSDMQDAASSAYYKQNPQPYEGEYGSPETDKFDQVSTDLFSKGGLTLQDKLDLGYSTNSLIPDIAKAPAQERTQLMSSLMPQEQQVVNAIAANNGQETLADKMRLYVTGGEGNYADFKADLAKLDPAGVQALKNDYAAKYNGDLDNDYLAKVDSKDRSQYESLLTPTASDGRQTFYDNLQKQLSDSGASMDGTAATMQRSVDQTASSLEQYQRVYQTLPKEKQQALDQYFNDSLEGRQQSKEKLAEIATTAVITAAALAAAPFTAGTSVALVASLAFAAGAATKTVMTAAIEGNDFQWTPENLAKNVVEGGVSAALNFVGAGGGVGALEGIGTKVAGDVVKDVAVDSLRDGGEKVLQDGVTQLIAKGGTEVTEAQVAALAERVAATGASAEEKAAVAASIERAVAAHATDITALSSKVGQSALQALGKEVLTSSAIGGSANAASTLAAAPFNSNGLNVNELVTSTLTGMAMGAVMPIGLHAFMGARQLVAGVSRETTTIDGVTKDVAMIHPPKAGDPAFVIHRGDTEIHMDAGSQPVQLQEGDTFKAADTGAPITQSSATVDSSLPVGAGRPAGAPNAVESVNPAETPTSAENVKPVEVAKPGEPGPEAQITAMPENLGAVAEKAQVTDVSVANLTDTKQITDSIHQGIADMHAGKPVTFHIDDTVQVPQLNDKGEVIMDGDKPKMISQGQLLYNELAKDMPDRDFNFAKGGADFTAVKPDADVRVSTKESTLALNKPVDVTTVDGATTNLPVGTKFSNGTILDGDKIRSADPNGEVWAQTPDGQLHQLTSDKVAETTIPGTAIDNGNIVAGKDTLVLSDKNGVTVKGTDGADVQLKQGTRLSNGATVDAEGRITTTDPSGKIYAVSPDGTRTELAAGTTINPTSLDHGQNLLVRIGFGDSVMNKQDDFINFDQTLKDNNQSLGNGRFAPNAGAMRDHFDLPDNVNVEANTAYGMQDIKGTEHYLMPNGFGNAGENVVLNYRGIPKDASGNFDLNSARRLLKEFKDNHLDAPRPLVDAVNDGNVKELAAMGPPSKDLKFAGVYDGPIGREEATQINQIQAAQQKLFNDSVDTILEGTATDAAKLDQLRGIAFSDAAKDMPPNNLMKLYTAFRDKGDTEDMLRLYETTPNQDFKNSPFVREYLAAAYNKKGLAGKSLDVVKSLEQDAQTRPELMNGEVYGAAAKAHVIRREKAEALLGAVQSGDMAKIAAARDEYAKAYDLQPGESLPDAGQLKAQSQTELLAARDAYTKGFHVNYEYYPGINAVWSSLALGDLKNATNLAEITQLATVREGGLERNNYWTSMTMLESSLVGGASNADIDATIGKIVGGNKINQPDLRSTLNAWDSRVRPALQKLQSDPIQGAEATSMLERFDYAEKKLNEAVENPNSIQKATQVSTTADALRERSHSYRGQSVYDAEIVKNNFQYGGIITDTSIARRDRLEFGKLLNAPLGDLMATFGGDVSKMPGVTADMRLTDIKDPEQFVAVAQQLVRQNFGTAAKNLEIIDSLEHKLYYDHPIESLNKASGIPADRIARQGYDSRTSLSAEWAKGLGDCRHHAQSMQLLYDMWQGGRLNGFLRQAETAATPEARAAAIGSFKDLERTQLRTLDVMVNAPIKVKGAYEPIRPDTDTSLPAKLSFIADDSVNYIEDHTMNILTRSDEQGHVESARYADSFYNNTYNWSNGPIKLQQAADGSITFPGGDLDGVLGMAGNKAPVTMQFAPYSGTRTKTAANDIGDIYERGLRVDNFDIMDVMKRRAYIESQLMALTPTD
jgi:hypothetical protein